MASDSWGAKIHPVRDQGKRGNQAKQGQTVHKQRWRPDKREREREGETHRKETKHTALLHFVRNTVYSCIFLV